MEILTDEFLWATIIAFTVIGVAVLAKTPELLVGVLMIGGEFIQWSLKIFGFTVTRRTFAAAGAVLFFPIVVVLILMRMLQTREREPIIGRANFSFVAVTIILGIVLLVGLIWTQADRYGTQKTAEYFIFGMAPMFLTFVFIRDRAALRRLMVWLLVIGGLNVLMVSGHALATRGTIRTTMIFIEETTEWGMEVPGHGGLSTSALMVFTVLMFHACRLDRGIWRWAPLIFLPLVAWFILYAGTRSNLVAFLAVVAFGFWFTYHRHRGLLIIGVMVLLVVLPLLLMSAEEDVMERMNPANWFDPESRHGGGYGRIQMLKRCLQLAGTAPVLGHGTGAWPFQAYGLDVYEYPHNMFGEILVENGVIGLAVLLTVWFLISKRIWHCLNAGERRKELRAIGVIGACFIIIELGSALAHFGIAHHSCTLLLFGGVILRGSFLVEEEESVEGGLPPLEGKPLHATLTG